MVPHNIFFMVVQYYTSPAFQFSVWPFQATKIRLTVDSVSFVPLSATSIVALLILAPSAAALFSAFIRVSMYRTRILRLNK